MTRRRAITLLTLVAAILVVAGGCAGGAGDPASQHPSPLPVAYAVFHIHGSYGSGSPALFARRRFTLTCPSRTHILELAGRPSWRQRLCLALLDYQAAPKRPSGDCLCAYNLPAVHVAGRIQGRRVRETFTRCICARSARVTHDVLTILQTHPPVRTAA